MFTAFLRTVIRYVKDDSYLKMNNFKWVGAAPERMSADFFERIFFIKNTPYFSFRVDFGVRLLLLMVINAYAFYICWEKSTVLAELIFRAIDYNTDAKFFALFRLHTLYSEDLFEMLLTFDPKSTFTWYLIIAIFFFNFSRFDHILLTRYRRTYFSINLVEIFLTLLSVVLFFFVYGYFSSVVSAWISHVFGDVCKYGSSVHVDGLIPMVSGVYTLGVFQAYLVVGSYVLLYVVLHTLLSIRGVYYLGRTAVLNWYQLFLGMANSNIVMRYALKPILAYLIFKLIKITVVFILLCKVIYDVTDSVVFTDSLGGVFFIGHSMYFYITLLGFFIITAGLNTVSNFFIFFWSTIMYLFLHRLNTDLSALEYSIISENSTNFLTGMSPLTWLFILFAIATVLTTVLVLACLVIGPRKNYSEKIQAYECGFHALGNPRENFSVNFFLLAVLFLIFDLEIVFVMPLVVKFESLVFVEFTTGLFFIFFLFLGFIYEWRRNALNL